MFQQKLTANFPDLRSLTDNKLQQVQIICLRLLKIFATICDKNNLSYWLDYGTLLGAVRYKGFIPWDDDVDVAMPRKDFLLFIKIAGKYLPEDVFLQTFNSDKYYSEYNIVGRLRDKYSTIYSKKQKNSKSHKGIFIDIFVYDQVSPKPLIRILQQKLYKWLIMPAYMNSFKYRNSITGMKKLRMLLGSRITHLIGIKKFTKWVLQLGCKSNFLYREALESSGNPYLHNHKTIFPITTKLLFEDYDFWVPNNYTYYLKCLYGDYMQFPPVHERKPSHGYVIHPFTPCKHSQIKTWQFSSNKKN